MVLEPQNAELKPTILTFIPVIARVSACGYLEERITYVLRGTHSIIILRLKKRKYIIVWTNTSQSESVN